jgi:hypothetical protein
MKKEFQRKLASIRRRSCGHVLIINEEGIPKRVMNTKVKGKCPRGRP